MISQFLASQTIAESGDRQQPASRWDAHRTQRPATAFEKRCASWLNTPVIWLRRIRVRQELATLDQRQLFDAGLDLLAVQREIAKPFWRD